MARSALVELVNGNVYVYKGVRFERDIPIAVEPQIAEYLETLCDLKAFAGGGGRVAIQKFDVEYMTEKQAVAIQEQVASELKAEQDAASQMTITNTIKAVSRRKLGSTFQDGAEPVMIKKAVSARKRDKPVTDQTEDSVVE